MKYRLPEDLSPESLRASGYHPGDSSSKLYLNLDPAQTALEATRTILRHLLETMERNLDGTRRDLDPEFLHDFRVAVRRTRSVLGQIKKVLPTQVLETFRPEFAWLGTLTSPTRDLDVYLIKFETYRNSLPLEVRADLAPLRDFLVGQQRAAQRALSGELDSPRFKHLATAWRSWLDSPLSESGNSGPAANLPVVEVAGQRIRKVFQRALKQGSAITDLSPAEDLHELRKTCKKLRYLLEFFQSLYPRKKIRSLIRALKGLQDNLGEFQDLEVQSHTLRDFGRQMRGPEPFPPETLLAMGMLVEKLRARQEAARREFSARFADFTQPLNRELVHELFGKKQTVVSLQKKNQESQTARERAMGGCMKGKSENRPKEDAYQCHKCGAVSKKKDHLCKPEKLTKKDVKKIEKKQKKEK